MSNTIDFRLPSSKNASEVTIISSNQESLKSNGLFISCFFIDWQRKKLNNKDNYMMESPGIVTFMNCIKNSTSDSSLNTCRLFWDYFNRPQVKESINASGNYFVGIYRNEVERKNKTRNRPGILKVAILLEEEKEIDKTLMYPSLPDDYVFNSIDGYNWYLNIPSLKNFLQHFEEREFPSVSNGTIFYLGKSTKVEIINNKTYLTIDIVYSKYLQNDISNALKEVEEALPKTYQKAVRVKSIICDIILSNRGREEVW